MRQSVFWFISVLCIVFTARLIPHPTNFSPIAALLLLSPLALPKQRHIWIAVLTGLFFSDLFLGFHSTILYVYSSYLLIAIIGHKLKTQDIHWKWLATPIVSALLFYTITNFGVWMTTTMYTKDLAGLLQSYWMGIPFLKMTFVGDFFYFSTFTILIVLKNYAKVEYLSATSIRSSHL